MKLEEAIKDVENSLSVLWENYPQHRKDAVKLLIEAGKRIKECRLADYMIREDLLPGETDN